ncbi:G5 domain-containing protein [Candidatus Saccharibacteria bacterium]|nr:G5 domain-containing protein [Candidatus Saccharibacteria bacterium]
MRFRKKQARNLLLLLLVVATVLALGIVFRGRQTFAEAEGDLISDAVEENETAESEHYINIYDNGTHITVRSDATTVREVLERAEIRYTDRDNVEPGLDEEIDGREYNINIYRARRVLVLDGGEKHYANTAKMVPEDIAEVAGVELKDKDIVKLVHYDDILETGMLSAFQVVRAKTVKLDYYGKKTTLRTQAKTVEEFLNEQNISTDKEKNWVSIPLEQALASTNEISVYLQGKQTITVDETIPFSERVNYDYDLTWGQEKITQPGQNGQKTVTYEIDMRDGIEISREYVSEIVTRETVEQIKTVGRKATLPPGSHEDWMAAAGIDSGDYGYVNYIISHESGWRPYAVSSNGYYGLYQTNQARLIAACGEGWMNDPVCQLRSATSYATGRYGSWAGAYQFWVSHNWW